MDAGTIPRTLPARNPAHSPCHGLAGGNGRSGNPDLVRAVNAAFVAEAKWATDHPTEAEAIAQSVGKSTWYFSRAATNRNSATPDRFSATVLPTRPLTELIPSRAMIAVVRGVTFENWVNTSGDPAMIDAKAGVVLPPKLKSALPPVTAWMDGAWFGNGPTHSDPRSIRFAASSIYDRVRDRPSIPAGTAKGRGLAGCSQGVAGEGDHHGSSRDRGLMT